MKSLQLDSPHAIIVVGIQGSGKSFFAQKFSDTFKAPFIDESVFMMATRDEKAGKQLMTDVLNELIKTGSSLVIEQAFSSKTTRQELNKKLTKSGYTPLYVWVQVDAETAIARSARLYRIRESEYRESMKAFNPPVESEKALVISGKHTFATQAKAILKRISASRPRPSQPPAQRSQPPRGQIIVR